MLLLGGWGGTRAATRRCAAALRTACSADDRSQNTCPAVQISQQSIDLLVGKRRREKGLVRRTIRGERAGVLGSRTPAPQSKNQHQMRVLPRERICIELITPDRKLKASREGSNKRICGPQTTQTRGFSWLRSGGSPRAHSHQGDALPDDALHIRPQALPGYLAHKKHPPPRTLQ